MRGNPHPPPPPTFPRGTCTSYVPPWQGVICSNEDDEARVVGLDLGAAGLTFPLGGVLPRSTQELCHKSGVDCAGFPPNSCAVFGEYARMSLDPSHIGECLDCAGVNRGALIAVLVIGMIVVIVAGIIYVRANDSPHSAPSISH